MTDGFKSINSYLKNRYKDGVRLVVPKQAKLRGMVNFNKADKTGNLYNEAVTLTYEHGFSAGEDAFELNGASPSTSGTAYIKGQSMILQCAISYESASRAGSSEQAMDKWFSDKVIPRVMSFDKRLEILSWYGQEQKGTVGSITKPNATTAVVTLLDSDYAEGIWVGMEQAKLDAFSGSTIQNTNGGYLITEIDIGAGTLKVTGHSDDITALTVGDTLEFYKMRANGGVYSEMLGISQWFSQASLFGISTTNSLWKPESHAIGGALSLAGCLAAVTKAVNKGLDNDVKLFINHKPFVTLANTEAGLRRYNADVKKAENGSQSITFYSVNGAIEIVPHAVIKRSHGFVLTVENLMYIGSTDITAEIPGMPEEAYFVVPAANKAGAETRLYCDLAIFGHDVAKMVKLTGITA